MQVQEKTGQTITEPITAANFRTFMGLVDTTQDTLIASMIIAAREWIENYTGRSLVSKVYIAEFPKADGFENWYELPFSPVTDIASVKVGTTTVSYHERGLKVVEIYPESVISTGTSNNVLTVEFTAGGTDEVGIQALYRVVADLYNHRYDNQGVTSSLLSWNTSQLVDQLKTFTF